MASAISTAEQVSTFETGHEYCETDLVTRPLGLHTQEGGNLLQKHAIAGDHCSVLMGTRIWIWPCQWFGERTNWI